MYGVYLFRNESKGQSYPQRSVAPQKPYNVVSDGASTDSLRIGIPAAKPTNADCGKKYRHNLRAASKPGCCRL